MAVPGDITQLLVAFREGERSAIDEVFPLVYQELRGMARQRLRRRRPGQTLDTTALVHEAYLKLVDQTRAQWKDRGHFPLPRPRRRRRGHRSRRVSGGQTG